MMSKDVHIPHALGQPVSRLLPTKVQRLARLPQTSDIFDTLLGADPWESKESVWCTGNVQGRRRRGEKTSRGAQAANPATPDRTMGATGPARTSTPTAREGSSQQRHFVNVMSTCQTS